MSIFSRIKWKTQISNINRSLMEVVHIWIISRQAVPSGMAYPFENPEARYLSPNSPMSLTLESIRDPSIVLSPVFSRNEAARTLQMRLPTHSSYSSNLSRPTKSSPFAQRWSRRPVWKRSPKGLWKHARQGKRELRGSVIRSELLRRRRRRK